MSVRYFKTVTTILITLLLLFGYNNCQPIGESVSTFKRSSSSGSGGGSGGGGGLPGVQSEGEKFFFDKLVPVMQTSCNSCHNEPRLVTGIAAPLTIYNYDLMKSHAEQGNSSVDNYMINKALNVESHAGGGRCANSVASSPCKEISEWVSIEFPLKAAGFAGAVKNTSALGRVSGYAFKPSDETATYDVFVLDAPVGSGGQIIAQVPANELGMGTGQGHHFSFDIPEAYRDGTERNLYIYVESAVADNILPNMPYKYAAYAPKAGGQDFYNNNVSLNQCNGCHQFSYTTAYNNLLDPTPYKGGTNETNTLIRKANGELSHGGGSFCGGDKNSGPCATIKAWWDFEFGP